MPGTAVNSQNTVRTVLSGVWRGLCYGVLLLTLGITAATIVVPKIAGAVPLTVLSNSMAPTMPVGSLAVVKPTMPLDVSPTDLSSMSAEEIGKVNDLSDIQGGDVIAFQPEANDPTLVMHRVLAKTTHQDGSRTFETQGDNNPTPDDPVESHMVRAEVWYHLPLLGYVNDAIGAGPAHTTAVIAIAVVGYAWAMTLFFRAVRHNKRTTATIEETP